MAGSAGHCEPGVDGLPTHTLCPAFLSHPFCCPFPGPFSTGLTRAQIRALGAWGGSFPYPGGKSRTQALTGRRNPMLFRRKRRVLCTRGFLSDQATGLVLHTGPNGGQQGSSQSGLLLCTKNPLPGFAWRRSCDFVMEFAGILPILPRPPARRGISGAGSPPAPWRCPITIGWR